MMVEDETKKPIPMTATQHPITPPPELVKQWAELPLAEEEILVIAYRAGADQELEACVEWLGDAPVVYNNNGDLHPGSYLRDARRPKPPSLKEQALHILDTHGDLTRAEADTIRKALEALPND
jgi:hypothetical protein